MIVLVYIKIHTTAFLCLNLEEWSYKIIIKHLEFLWGKSKKHIQFFSAIFKAKSAYHKSNKI